ncbi:MAG: ATP synthase F1 subunit delta [Deltaproteobacteria bacterium]|nr:ATP synthase F1 subunit delta [Deltaproteobacteria bacterium]
MIEDSLSRRYSKALFQLAREAGQEESTGDELERGVSAYNQSPLQTVLSNPAFALESRKKILIQVSKSLQLSLIVEHFLALLLERDRLDYLPSIVASYRRMINEAKGFVEAKIVATASLEAAVTERLRGSLRRLSGKEVIVHEESDPQLMGGLIVELEGKVYDGSVRTQLEKMKQRIARGF